MKTKIILCALIAMLSLSGCGIVKIIHYLVTGEAGEHGITPDEEAQILCEQVFDSVRNHDKEKLKSLFCKKLQETHDLDKEIDEFFDFIDGEIISYDEPDGGPGVGKRTAEDGLIIDQITGEIYNIKTDTGKTYSIVECAYRIYKSDESLVGITGIRIIDEDKLEKEGKLLEGYYYDIDL